MRKVVFGALLAVLSIGGPAGIAVAQPEDPPGPDIITDTSYGEAMLDSYEGLVASRSDEDFVDVDSYQVITGVPGDQSDAVWVLPPGEPLPEVTYTEVGNQFSLHMSSTSAGPTIADLEALGETGLMADEGSAAVAAEPTAAWFAPICFARYTTTYGWFDRCRQSGGIQNDNDGDSSLAHMFMRYWGTCKSDATHYVQTCGLESYKSSSAPLVIFTWEDWAPKADSDAPGQCRSISTSVSAFGVGISGSYSACDRVNITKYADAAHFSNEFVTPSAYQTERSVEYQVSWAQKEVCCAVPSIVTNAWMTGYLKIG